MQLFITLFRGKILRETLFPSREEMIRCFQGNRPAETCGPSVLRELPHQLVPGKTICRNQQPNLEVSRISKAPSNTFARIQTSRLISKKTRVPFFPIPSGKRLRNYGKSSRFSWENPRTKSQFSIALCMLYVYQRVNHHQITIYFVVSIP